MESDLMRQEYRPLTEEEQRKMRSVKEMGTLFCQMLDQLGNTTERRELIHAQARVEEAVMWAVKSITKAR